MALGPMIIFDKSTLQSLSLDESVWLENFFLTNITPLFYIETLADLEKQVRAGRNAEQVVGSIARKTPDMSSYPNVNHSSLISAELLGHADVEMSGRVILGSGQPMMLGDKTGIIFKQAAETEAFQRWQRGEFLDIERQGAKKWREALSNINHEENYSFFKKLYTDLDKPKSLEEVKLFVDKMINSPDQESSLRFGLNVIGVPEASQEKVINRYLGSNKKTVREFAPYFFHIYSVDLFFYMAMAADLISRIRPSNKVDLAYLYYLPFCMVFASNDNLHERIVPLFLRNNQTFLRGVDLKCDLANLNEYYLKLPDEIKRQGTMRFASYPPIEGSYLVSQLWDKYLPLWRKHQAECNELTDKPMSIPEGLKDEIQRFKEEGVPIDPMTSISSDEVDHVGFERRVSIHKGNWRRFPPEVEGHA